jgi:hypothetical protein
MCRKGKEGCRFLPRVLLSPPSFKCNVLRESLSVDSQNIPYATLKRGGTWVISALLQELLKMKLSSGILQNIGMKKPPVGAGTFCPLYILLFSIPPCRKYLPVSGARDSPYCYRKIPEDPQIKNVRKNCRRFTAWGGKVQDLAIFSKVRNNRGSLVYSL